jgi:acyl-CoA synthetase (AMP-forming)/AMP-acid ligase II/acyl carrier protein
VALILGILKAGGSCVPLDASFNEEQIEAILDQGDISFLLSEKATQFSLDGVKVVNLEREQEKLSNCPRTNPSVAITLEQAAFILYTESTASRSKGTTIGHRALASMVAWSKAVFSEEELSGVAACSRFTQSSFLFELLAPLCLGGKTILIDDLRQTVVPPIKDQIRLLSTTPTAIRALLQHSNLPATIRTVNLHGEPLSAKTVDLVYERSSAQKVNHLYCTPESAGFATCAFRTSGGPDVMGRPVANTQAYVLDEKLQTVPLGVTGELCLSGQQMAPGYYRNDALTAEGFVPHPFSKEPGALLHRTGDLCKLLPDGNLVYLGKKERQALVRGTRLYPETVEMALLEYPGVLRASITVVPASSQSESKIVAFVMPHENATVSQAELKQFLRSKVQEQWIPSSFVIVSELPTRPNGKPDYAAFPVETERNIEQPSVPEQMTPLQQTLAKMWCDVIGLDEVGIHDNFFDLGGHSVLVTQIVSRIRKTLSVNLSLRSVFDYPTIAELSTVIEDILVGEMDKTSEAVERTSELLPKE